MIFKKNVAISVAIYNAIYNATFHFRKLRKKSTISACAANIGVGLALMNNYDINIVPFNGEEYYEASDEVEYLKYINSSQDRVSLVINIDSPCHAGSKIAASLYNFDDPAKDVLDHLMQTQNEVVYGTEWYAGDHAAFAFRGIPCMVLSSSDLFEGGLDNTHTMRDTLDTVDLSQIELAVNFINHTILQINK